MAQSTDKNLKTFLESFLPKQGESEPALTRESNDSYEMHNSKYIIHRKPKEPILQYATLYFLRLEKLRPLVYEAAQMKWNKHQHLKFVENILDIKSFEETVIIGTLFKEQKLKPSILNNIMGVLGQNKFLDAQGKFKHGMFVNKDESDVAVLEDKSGRITIRSNEIFDINHYVSGTIVALKGQEVTGGYFQVSDICFAGIPTRDDCPASVQIDVTRDLYDEHALQARASRQFIALVSGIQFGRLGCQLP